jgi:hypothetical protein
MFTREGITEDIQNAVKIQLEKNGFVHDIENEHNKYIKYYSWGYDYCFLPHVRFQPEHILFSLTVHRRIDFIEKIWQEWHNLININIEDSNDITTLYVTEKNAYPEIINKSFYDGYGSFIFEISEKGLSEVENVLELCINQKIIPKLNSYNDLNSLNYFINNNFQFSEDIHGFLNHNGLIYRRIIIARLTSFSEYENLCNYFRDSFDWYIENGRIEGQEYFLNYPIVFEKVYERLKNIEPLKNTILSEKAV